jgi:glycosyltransferase involved in cell wall biosynthesis
MPELTICMPSHRNLQDSRAAIESALAFCEKRDAVLIVSDNSGDETKKAFWADKYPSLTYLESDAQTATDNMIFAVKAAVTPFIMLMGDDDLIVAEEGAVPVDLADLPFDYVGVFPTTESYLSSEQLGPVSQLSLEQDDASERLLAYMEQNVHNNGAFYSIFRRDIWLATFDLFARFHPTQAASSYWALSLSLLTSGKMARDASIRYRYNMANWATKDLILARRQKVFSDAGLPDKAMSYERLFLFLDVFVLISRVGSPLSIDERQRLGKLAVNVLFGNFIAEVANAPEQYEEGVSAMAEMVLEEKDSFTQFQLGLLMIERVQPGLKDKYVAFIQASISGA